MLELDPPPPPGGIPPFSLALGLTVAVFATFVTVGGPAQLLNPAAGIWFTEVIVFLGFPFAVLGGLGRPPLRVTGLDSAAPVAVGLGAALGLFNYAGWAVPLMAMAQRFFPKEILERFDGAQLFANQSTLERIIFVVGVSLAAPVCEEFFFRGVVQRGLMSKLSPPVAIAVTAILFSGFHLDPVGFAARLELGVLFGLLAFRSGSLWPGIAAHAVNNAVATSLFLSSRGADENELPLKALIALVIIGNLGVLALAGLARGRLLAPRPANDDALAPPVPLWRGALPFMLGGALALSAVVTLDWRGVTLRLYDATHPLPRELATTPELVALRARARAGEVPLEEYYDARSLMMPARNERK